jgi:hypothetical protein
VALPFFGFGIFRRLRGVFDVADDVEVPARQQRFEAAFCSGLFRFDMVVGQDGDRSCGRDGEKEQDDENECEPWVPIVFVFSVNGLPSFLFGKRRLRFHDDGRISDDQFVRRVPGGFVLAEQESFLEQFFDGDVFQAFRFVAVKKEVAGQGFLNVREVAFGLRFSRVFGLRDPEGRDTAE